MPIQFRCPKCDKRLSIAQRKAGMRTLCPSCGTPIAVPSDDAPPTDLPELVASQPSPAVLPRPTEELKPSRSNSYHFRVAALVAMLLSVAALWSAVAVSKRNAPAPIELARTVAVSAPSAQQLTPDPQPPEPAASPETPLPPLAPSKPKPSESPDLPQQPLVLQQPQAEPSQTAPVTPAPQQPVSSAPQQATEPEVPPQGYDRFGNPIGPYVGLGKDNEFKGKRLLFWSGYENAGKVFFNAANPLWKAWERLGFTVYVRFGHFRPEWLRDIDQLWILSTGRFELPLGVPPEFVVEAVDLLPLSAIPSGFTAAEYKYIVGATLDMSLSRVQPLDEQAYRAIEKFVKAGKGLCLLSDDEPFTVESNELARRLYGVTVKGNYIADKVAYVRDHKLTPADIAKFGGQYEVAHHKLLTGVNFLFEGITISNVGLSDDLEVALKASDGQPLIAVSKIPGQRVVIDCAFTQFCHGPTERTSYVLKSAGAVRLAQNIAAYLAGK